MNFQKQPDPRIDNLKSFASLLLENSDLIEMRVITTERTVLTGFYDDIMALVEHAHQFHCKGQVYLGLNPRGDEVLHGRGCNLLGHGEGGKNRDIMHRVLFPIDFDTIRPPNTAATDAELEAALPPYQALYKELERRGGLPIPAFSGNGRHLLIHTIPYPIDHSPGGMDSSSGPFALHSALA